MLSTLLSFPVIPSLIIASIITLCIYLIDSSDPENYIDKMYYLKVFIVSFISSNAVIYCFYHMNSTISTGVATPSTTPLKKKTFDKIEFSKLTQDVSDSIQTGGETAHELVAHLPDF